jgi:hypothetical protein
LLFVDVVCCWSVVVSVGFIAANGFGLGEVGDFNDKTSYEAPMFKFSKNCHKKH